MAASPAGGRAAVAGRRMQAHQHDDEKRRCRAPGSRPRSAPPARRPRRSRRRSEQRRRAVAMTPLRWSPATLTANSGKVLARASKIAPVIAKARGSAKRPGRVRHNSVPQRRQRTDAAPQQLPAGPVDLTAIAAGKMGVGHRGVWVRMFGCALAANTRPPGLRSLAAALISGASVYRLWRYTAYGISVADPGAVPGASTTPALSEGAKQARRAW